VNNRKDLEQRVSNGDKLDTADEATLCKLNGAYQSHKKHVRDNHQRGVKKRWSVAEDSMLADWLERAILLKPNGRSYHARWWTTLRSNTAIATTIA
jgi:hypothetical protein